MKARLFLAAAAAGAALLAGCGGGGGGGDADAPGNPAAPNQVPPGATASVAAYTQYVNSLPATDTGTPVDVSPIEAPTSETAAPAAL